LGEFLKKISPKQRALISVQTLAPELKNLKNPFLPILFYYQAPGRFGEAFRGRAKSSKT